METLCECCKCRERPIFSAYFLSRSEDPGERNEEGAGGRIEVRMFIPLPLMRSSKASNGEESSSDLAPFLGLFRLLDTSAPWFNEDEMVEAPVWQLFSSALMLWFKRSIDFILDGRGFDALLCDGGDFFER